MNPLCSLLKPFNLQSLFKNVSFNTHSPDIRPIHNFYNKYTKSPYVPIQAHGPWILTNEHKIIYDTGGYGMLGFGHNPDWLLQTLQKPHVMANVMTPSYEQEKIGNLLKQHTKYNQFSFLNSGSEGIECTMRILDKLTYENNTSNKDSCFVNLESCFHGRTFMAASLSGSCKNIYKQTEYLQKSTNNVISVPINDIDSFIKKIGELLPNKYISGIIMEPVMGEGNPGQAITSDFYNCVRKISKENSIPLVIDSVQAGIRTNGCLSITNYPGFEKYDIPDFEIFSKAITNGHYPLSIIGIHKQYENLNLEGLYGNSMCANPKALDVCYETLSRVNVHVRDNIIEKGVSLKKMLIKLQKKHPTIITKITGTGLLVSAEINETINVWGRESLETFLRMNGLNVIHGGQNALRFTPHFNITDKEINLIYSILSKVFNNL